MLNIMIGNWIVVYCGLKSSRDLARNIHEEYPIVKLGEESPWNEIHMFEVRKCIGVTIMYLAVHSASSRCPSIIQGKNTDHLIIGFDHIVAFVDVYNTRLLSVVLINGVLFFAKWHNDKLIVISEIGIAAIDNNYQRLYNISTDIIEDFEFNESVLTYTAGSQSCKISLE